MSAAPQLPAPTEIDDAYCRHPAYRGRGGTWYWEGIVDGEGRQDRARRQAIGMRLCRACPMFDPCRRLLTDLDERGLRVDGVVAGQVRQWRTRRKSDGDPTHLAAT